MKRWVISVVFIVVLAGLIVWRLGVNHAAASAQGQERQSRKTSKLLVNVATASYHDIVHTFESVGNVDSPVSVMVGSKYAGPVDFIAGQPGDPVTRGEVLVRMDPSEAQANVNTQEGNVAQAQQHLAQAQITQNSNNVGVNATVLQQRATVAADVSNYESAVKNDISQQAAAHAAVVDAQAKLDAAVSQVVNEKAEVRSAEANLKDAAAKNTREQSLLKQGFVAAQDADDDEAAMEVQKANLDVANAQLQAAISAQASAAAELKSAVDSAATVQQTDIATIAAAKAQVNEARAALAAAVANLAQQPAYTANLKALEAAVVAAQAQLHDAQVMLQETILTSPIDGFIVARMMDPGAQATAGQEILQVQAVKQVWITVPVPEEQTDKIHMGQTARVSVDGIPGQKFAGKVTQINASADPLNRQFSVRVTVNNPKNLIKPGMFATVHFVTSRIPHQIYIPREAVNPLASGGDTVFVVGVDGTVQSRLVTVGDSDTDGFAVLSGIQIGDKVVVLSAMPLRDGQTVQIAGSAGGHGHGHHHVS
ncbi:MAG: efflux RND transporter periplasmic adaptor subunit [Capsulimonadaceae bacterium]